MLFVPAALPPTPVSFVVFFCLLYGPQCSSRPPCLPPRGRSHDAQRPARDPRCREESQSTAFPMTDTLPSEDPRQARTISCGLALPRFAGRQPACELRYPSLRLSSSFYQNVVQQLHCSFPSVCYTPNPTYTRPEQRAELQRNEQPKMLHNQPIAGNAAATGESLVAQSQKQSLGQSQAQAQNQNQNQGQNQVFSPTMTDNSMAILSPPSSRYAFDPNASGNSINNLPMDSMLSPLLASVASPVSELNVASLNITAMSPPAGYGTENDVPAFQPETELLLENFTNDLKVFNNWVHGLNVEEQKAAIGLFIDSVRDQEVVDFIQRKISSAIPNEDSKGNITFSPPLSANTSLPQRLRPVSPIIPISNMNHRGNPVPITLDSILNSGGNDGGQDGNDGRQDNAVVYRPAPRRMLSPPVMKTGFSNIIEPIERPKSADPSYASSTAFVDQMGGGNGNGNSGYGQFNMSGGPMSPLLGNQPLFRVLSDGYQETAPENVSFNCYNYNGNGNTNNNGQGSGNGSGSEGTLGTKLQQSLNTINNRSVIDSNRNMKEDRGRHRNIQNKPSNLNLNLNMNTMNNLNTPKMGMNNLNYMNMSMLNNGKNAYGDGSGGAAAAAIQNLTQSISVPPHNRIRSANSGTRGTAGVTASATIAATPTASNTKLSYHGSVLASKLHPTHGYSKSGSSLGTMLHGGCSSFSSTSLLTEEERRALQAKKKTGTGASASASNGSLNTLSTPTTPTTNAANAANAANNAAGGNIPKDIASDALLADIPAWLKALRLHKYTENLQHLRWDDMVALDDAALAQLGVSTLGARNKLLKSFAYVREKRGLA